MARQEVPPGYAGTYPGACAACRASWGWAGTGWIVKDVHGRIQFLRVCGEFEPKPTTFLSRCPECGARLRTAGAAKVEEVTRD